MGTFAVPIEISNLEEQEWMELNALVDTRVSMLSLPASLLNRLNVQPTAKRPFEFEQGEVRDMEVGHVRIQIEGQNSITSVMFNDEGTQPRLGSTTLAGAFLAVNPDAQRLVPMRLRCVGFRMR